MLLAQIEAELVFPWLLHNWGFSPLSEKGWKKKKTMIESRSFAVEALLHERLVIYHSE